MSYSNWRERLVQKMNAAGLNPRRLAILAGLNPTAVRDILDGNSQSPRLKTISALANVLGCTVDELVGYEPLPGSMSSFKSDLKIHLSRLTDTLAYVKGMVDGMDQPVRYDMAVNAARRHWGLTKRELQILSWAAFGKSDGEIAIIMDISPHTANGHFRSIFAKMEVSTRALAIAKALQSGVLEPMLNHMKSAS